ncbi:MAG: hypothetical protein AAGD13_21795 [Pseudomonadota bacterium]
MDQLFWGGSANAAFTRQSQPEPERRAFFLYIDEFHNFTTGALAGMLSELRNFRVGLVLAHQHASQLDGQLLNAILGNVGTLLLFRVGATDAEALSRQLAAEVPTARDLSNLGNRELVVRLMVDGRQTKPFSATTPPLSDEEKVSRTTLAKRSSQKD